MILVVIKHFEMNQILANLISLVNDISIFPSSKPTLHKNSNGSIEPIIRGQGGSYFSQEY